jgi:cytochrome c oxidase cbb3-type subunit 3
MSASWSWFVMALVALNVAGCVWLIRWTGKRRPGDPKPDDTGHVWDGDLTEYNKPMPRWWIGLFYATIVFSLGYLVYYPGMGAWRGSSGWTSTRQHDADKVEADARLARVFAAYKERPLADLARDPDALRHGQSIFAHHCAACHGSDARGAKGFPNLADDIWHWGGSDAAILTSVIEGRTATMPPLRAVLGSEIAVTEAAVYVQSLASGAGDPALVAAGKRHFEALCIACHGAGGKGNPALGAPDLSDGYWLYGGDFASIRSSIADGRSGTMPAHAPLIGAERARLAAAWVYSLSRRASADGP